MSDPVEEALRAIEAKYYPLVLEGKALMPFHPREDVTVMVEAALKAERDKWSTIVGMLRAQIRMLGEIPCVVENADVGTEEYKMRAKARGN